MQVILCPSRSYERLTHGREHRAPSRRDQEAAGIPQNDRAGARYHRTGCRQEANARIGNEAGLPNRLRNLAMIHMARCRVSPVTRRPQPCSISGSVSAVSRVWQGRIVLMAGSPPVWLARSEEHTSELQSLTNLVCRLLLEKKKKKK